MPPPGFSSTDNGGRINVTFLDKDGTKVDLQVAEGDNLLDIAQANDLEMEGMSESPHTKSRISCSG